MFSAAHFRLLMGAIAMFLSGALGANLWSRGALRLSSPQEQSSANAVSSAAVIAERRGLIERELAGAPEFAAFVESMSRAFPSDWSRQLDAFAFRAAVSRTLDPPVVEVADILRTLRRNRGVVSGKSGDAALTRVFEAQARLTEALANGDKKICVDFLLGQSSPGLQMAMARSRAELAELANATLAAILDGGASPVARAPPDDADFDNLEKELRRRGLGQTEIAALLDGSLPDPPLADSVLCDAGLVYFEALKALPPDVRMRIYAFAIQVMGKA